MSTQPREGQSEKLFSYGTLQNEAVQLSTFGRKLYGQPDAIVGYKLSQVEITDPEVLAISEQKFHPIVSWTGLESDVVEGTVFNITPEELRQADEYEVDDYVRVSASLRSGGKAWVYVKADK